MRWFTREKPLSVERLPCGDIRVVTNKGSYRKHGGNIYWNRESDGIVVFGRIRWALDGQQEILGWREKDGED